MSIINLNSDWLLRSEELGIGPEKSTDVLHRDIGWLELNLPCDIHTPLIQNSIIKEPLEANNCFDCEWTENKSWWFKKYFTLEDSFLDGDVLELSFEALDAEADIFLNDHHIGHHRSAFYPFRQNVKSLVNSGKNVILVRVTSGLENYSESDIACLKKVSQIKDKYNRGDERRTMVRKPQYSYGWDWGPRVATCGIMKDVYIESFSKLSIRAVNIFTKDIAESAKLGYTIEMENFHLLSTIDCTINICVSYNGKVAVCLKMDEMLTSGVNYIEGEFEIQQPKLWWPNGMGEQPLYEIRISAEFGESFYEYKPFKIGIRTLKLSQEKIVDGRKFEFEINGVKMFSKGANWIPADSIYARITDEKYTTLIQESKNANINMLRVWGGGLYERDIFYDKCDELGILIWHDFMFACGVYPDHLEWFRNEVENEMEYQTKRLRNHSSIALWCGNNENQWLEFREDEEYRPLTLGGAVCYNKIAPRIVHQNCPSIPYWNSSPYGGEYPNNYDMGDAHIWWDFMMNTDMEKRITPEEYDSITAKFVSEYGYIGPCCKSSIIKYLGTDDIDMASEQWHMHNNTFEKETVVAGIAKHYIDPEMLEIDSYLLYAGLCQGLMYGYSLESIRFKENCGGGLFWMYNDTWGEVGWSIIDYYLKRKPAYYFVKRALSPTTLIIREKKGTVNVMGINETANEISCDLEYGYLSFDGQCNNFKKTYLKLKPYSRSTVFTFDMGEHNYTMGCCYVKPLNNCDIISPAILRTDVFRNLNIPKATITVSNFSVDNDTAKFLLKSDIFAHAVHFNMQNELLFSDEYFDMLPGEIRSIVVYNVAEGITESDINPISIYTAQTGS